MPPIWPSVSSIGSPMCPAAFAERHATPSVSSCASHAFAEASIARSGGHVTPRGMLLARFTGFAEAVTPANTTTRIGVSRGMARTLAEYARAMDLEILEALFLAEDRSAALAQLLPGSEDHDYFHCLHAQQRGDLDGASPILAPGPDRHGDNAGYRRLTLRQLMYRVMREPERAADDLRDRLGVSHWHEAEVAALRVPADQSGKMINPSRPTRLAPGVCDGAALLARGVETSPDLAQVTDEGLYELLAADLDATRRHVLLDRIHHTPSPQLVSLVAADLDTRGHQFGGSRIHAELTLDQLNELARKRPELATHRGWIEAVLRRMRPPASIDLVLDRDAREAYLVELWAFVAKLPPASHSLKAHVLWLLLDAHRRRAAGPDPELFAAFLQLPRIAPYAPQREVRSDQVAIPGATYSV